MPDPLVSFVIPVYNVAPYISECIESIQSQFFNTLEIICVNDGSTDGSKDILDKFADKDERVKVVNKANGGVSSARNAGIKLATGKYLCFVDGDDWLEPEYAQTLFTLAESNRADIVVFDGKVLPRVGWIERVMATTKKMVINNGADTLLAEGGCIPLMCNKFYRRDLIDSNEVLFTEDVTLSATVSVREWNMEKPGGVLEPNANIAESPAGEAEITLNGAALIFAKSNLSGYQTFAENESDKGALFQFGSNLPLSNTGPKPEGWVEDVAVLNAVTNWNPCPKGWRLPSADELRNLANLDSGTNGESVVGNQGKYTYTTWSSTNGFEIYAKDDTAKANILFSLPNGGFRNSTT